jgi:hypothetical protein
VAAIPVPESATVVVAGEAVLVMVTEPVTVLAAVGVNATLKVDVPPAARATGRVGVDTKANWEGAILKLDNVTELLPVLDTVMV